MDNLTMMLEDNNKAMSVLAGNLNDMMVAEIIYEFEGEEYVFKKCNEKKQQKILDEMLPGNDGRQAFESFVDFIRAVTKVNEIDEDMKAQVMNDMSKFICNVCQISRI